MNDLHRRFAEWLETGARDDPPRDAAVHASVCDRCQRKIAAFDALTAIDPGRAMLPPSVAVVRPRNHGWSLPRLAGAGASVVVLAASIAFGASQLNGARTSSGTGPSSGTPVQAVLGGQGLPNETPGGEVTATLTEQATGSPSATAIPSSAAPADSAPASATGTIAPATATAQPTRAATTQPTATPRPVTPTPVSTPSRTATPSAKPTASPTVTPSPTPSATPTLSPTPVETPTPSPTPSPTPDSGSPSIP
jgi:hypothetical protein